MVVIKKGEGVHPCPDKNFLFLGGVVIVRKLGVLPHPDIILGGVVRHLKVGGLVPYHTFFRLRTLAKICIIWIISRTSPKLLAVQAPLTPGGLAISCQKEDNPCAPRKLIVALARIPTSPCTSSLGAASLMLKALLLGYLC